MPRDAAVVMWSGGVLFLQERQFLLNMLNYLSLQSALQISFCIEVEAELPGLTPPPGNVLCTQQICFEGHFQSDITRKHF